MAYRPKDIQERILHRLKIAQGHLQKCAADAIRGGDSEKAMVSA